MFFFSEDVTTDLFYKLTHGKTCPIVIRGLIKDVDAVKKWDSNYFIENYGKTKLLNISKQNEKEHNAYTSFNRTLKCQNLSIEESVNRMLDKNSESIYINNITEIFSKHPELVNDLELDHIKKLDDSIDEKTWLKINMFMGGHQTGSSLHCAVAGNFFFNIKGRKKWILIHPKYSKYLKSTPSKLFEFCISGYDIENPTDELKKIPKYEVILESGDVLYNAPWWWHYVKNESNYTIGCAVRDHTVYYQNFYNNSFFMLMSSYVWKLNPIYLWMLDKFIGRETIKNESMKSDKYIVNNLTDHPVEPHVLGRGKTISSLIPENK